MGGRPPKFATPSRRVTVTLPETTLHELSLFDSDRSRAIAKATKAAVTKTKGETTVEVVSVSPGTGLIIVGPNRYLRNIEWLRMVAIAPGRHLLSLAPGTQVDSLEVRLSDLLETIPPKEQLERRTIQMLLDLVRSLRRGNAVSKGEILLVAVKDQRA